MASTWFASPGPRVIAHRGLARQVPENTLPAFLEAMALGVTHLETDVHASSDGVAIVSHDPDLGRVGGQGTAISRLSTRDIARIRLPGDTQVPSLEDALYAFPDACFNIDIKVDEALEPTIAAIRRQKAIHRVLVTSFDERRRRAAVSALPGVATSPSSTGVVLSALASRVPLPALQARVLRGVQALQVPERHRGIPIVTDRLIEMAHDNGVEVHVWTVNDAADMARLLDAGVDGLITDRADRAVDLLRTRSG